MMRLLGVAWLGLGCAASVSGASAKLVRVGFGTDFIPRDNVTLARTVVCPEYTRGGLDWAQMEPRPGVYYFSAFDNQLTCSWNTKIIMCVAKPWPSWLPQDSAGWIAAHARLMKAIAARYGSRLYAIDLNEPWIDTPMLPKDAVGQVPFGKFLADDTAACVRALRSAGSKTLYLGPAWHKMYMAEVRTYCEAMQKHPKQDWPAAIDVHQYDLPYRDPLGPAPDCSRNSLEFLSKWWPNHPPVWLTEFAASDSNSAKQIQTFIDVFRKAGTKVFIYHTVWGSVEFARDHGSPEAWIAGQYWDGSLRPKIKVILNEFPLQPTR